MNALLVILTLGLAGAIAFLRTWRRSDPSKDLGVVSHQWIAEHRLGSELDSRR
jgi:hypothetical protein